MATIPTTTFSVNYQKRKNVNLFTKLQNNPHSSVCQVQNYIPIYDRFFSLNNTNYNSINLNHLWYVSDIKDDKNPLKKDDKKLLKKDDKKPLKKDDKKSLKKDDKNDDKNDDHIANIFSCKLKNMTDDSGSIVSSQSAFIKMAPLLDPFKYIVGKYNCDDTTLFNLPSFDKSVLINPKIADVNNAAYVDSFFSYLTSQLLNTHKFIHGLDYYGSFLGIKHNYKINVIDDIEYLIHSEFFIKQQNILFNIEDYSHLLINDNEKPLKPLNIMNTSHKSGLSLSAKSIDDSMFENIFADTNTNLVTLSDIKSMNVELVDIMNSNELNIDTKKSETLKSGSSCSSRTSYTDENADTENISISESETNLQNSLKGSDSDSGDKPNEDLKDDDLDDDDLEDDEDNYSDLDEESLWLTLPKFPVQLICMEHCENTFDNLILTTELTNDEWFSALMQIIMILITYQKTFSFTHNDLHTNNVMYISTNKKFIYYCYKKKYYKVPTFGKIFKIIDFGRAIYKLNGNVFCSDSFQTGGDAATQYNTEPYFNDKKPRLEPNYSFDLCRLACSIFDYIIDDIADIKNTESLEPIAKLINEWCIDDNGINILYKNNGSERYPDFKLYKMIARCVHNHTPSAQLERPEFSKFSISKTNIDKKELVINIDELPIYSS